MFTLVVVLEFESAANMVCSLNFWDQLAERHSIDAVDGVDLFTRFSAMKHSRKWGTVNTALARSTSSSTTARPSRRSRRPR